MAYGMRRIAMSATSAASGRRNGRCRPACQSSAASTRPLPMAMARTTELRPQLIRRASCASCAAARDDARTSRDQAEGREWLIVEETWVRRAGVSDGPDHNAQDPTLPQYLSASHYAYGRMRSASGRGGDRGRAAFPLRARRRHAHAVRRTSSAHAHLSSRRPPPSVHSHRSALAPSVPDRPVR
jgi:hypothetical protein